MPKFDDNTEEIAKYLKTIDLDKKLNKASIKIKNEEIITEKYNKDKKDMDRY